MGSTPPYMVVFIGGISMCSIIYSGDNGFGR